MTSEVGGVRGALCYGGKKVLVCGHRSFAAQGLVQLLRKAGHEVVCFSRGPVGEQDGVVTGPVDEMGANPHLASSYDALVNYIMLKDGSIQRNLEYAESLLRFCRDRCVRHLVHISSVSVYKASVRMLDERAAVEADPRNKGPYGAVKVAVEQYLVDHLPRGTKLSMVRPGFMLGSGLVNPIVGTAVRLPWNRLLALGNSASRMPLITRDLVNEAILRVIAQPQGDDREVLLLVDPGSPGRKEYLEACCKGLGCGTGVIGLPVPLWLMAGLAAEGMTRLTGRWAIRPWTRAKALCARHRFDSSRTQERLGMDLAVDWRSALVASLDGQERSFHMPPLLPGESPKTDLSSVAFIGFGRIVRQKYLPALRRLGFKGTVNAYDLEATVDETGQRVEAITSAPLVPADLFVIASPGRVHTEAIRLLEGVEGPVLVEKPLCYTVSELREWERFAGSRKSRVMVCHNYRFKENVLAMLSFLLRFNPGRLHHVAVDFQSPPVSAGTVAWSRDERRTQTLLMDFALHFLDLACMFASGDWQLSEVRHELSARGETALIEGRSTSHAYSVSFLLRQGFGPRRARLLFSFQNYSVRLGFFPDTLAVYISDDNPWLHVREALASAKAVSRKLLDRITGKDSDLSHARVLASATGSGLNVGLSLEVGSLAPFYRMVFEISEAVYKDAA